MTNVQSKSSYGSTFLGLWLLGGSFISFSAALVFLIGQAQVNMTSYLVYTILGAVFLVLGIGALGLGIKKMVANDPNLKPATKVMVLFMIFTILVDAVLIVVANVVPNPFH